jgi:hypothetical protein
LKPRKQQQKAPSPKDDDLSVPVWLDPHMTAAFYKRLVVISGECQVPRYQVIQQGMELFLQHHREEHRFISRVVKDKTSAKEVRKLLGKISKEYWDTLTEQQKRERGQRAAAGRWGKKKNAPASDH